MRDIYNIEKTHNNDAFIIAGGTNQSRGMVFNFVQQRRNNRALERFYDAKYRDIRDGSIQKASILSSGRTQRNAHIKINNQRGVRSDTFSKGKRVIRRRHYYQPGDIVEFLGNTRIVKGTMNNGKSVSFNDLLKPGRDQQNPKTLDLLNMVRGYQLFKIRKSAIHLTTYRCGSLTHILDKKSQWGYFDFS